MATIALGALIAWAPQRLALPQVPNVGFAQLVKPRAVANSALEQAVRMRFEQGVMMLHMREYDYALKAFQNVLGMVPDMPEAHVNMGFALIGLEEWASARSFFETAIELNRNQINAYYGLAVVLEASGDLPSALGAMQAYIHRAPEDDPFRTRAMAALWEWREAAAKANAAGGGEGAQAAAAGEAAPPGGEQSATAEPASPK